MSSCVASCCTCFPKVSSASATSASSPTAGVPLSCRFAIDYSTQNRHRNPNQKPRQPSRRTHFGSVPNVAAPWWSSRDLLLPITCRRGAPLLPPTKLLAWNFRTQTTIEPIRPALRLAPPAIPQGFLITVTPLNLHKCFLTGGFLQTAVSDAPRTPPEIDLPPTTGASDTALAFLDRRRRGNRPAPSSDR